MTTKTADPVERVLKTAKNLNILERLSLANALLQDIPERLLNKLKLPLLSGLTQQELHTLSKTSLSPTRDRRMKHLLKKNREGSLNLKESLELDALLAESDQIALLKAKAQYTLKKIQEK